MFVLACNDDMYIEQSAREVTIKMSYVEIYNEVIKDLLNPTGMCACVCVSFSLSLSRYIYIYVCIYMYVCV